MNALTLTQPWATLIATGQKRIETRSWRVAYRGPLAIHAAKGYPPAARTFAAELVQRGVIDTADLPRAVVLCTANLWDIRPTEELREVITPGELSFGFYEDGRWGWLLRDIRPVEPPVPARGKLGLWHWDGAVAEEAAQR